MDGRLDDGRAARADRLLLDPSVKGGDHLGVEGDVYGSSDSAHVLHEDTIRNAVQMSMRVRTLVDRSSAIGYILNIRHGRDDMDSQVNVNLYFNERREARYSVSQVFPKSERTDGHEIVLRQNMKERGEAQRYADRVSRVGFEYA